MPGPGCIEERVKLEWQLTALLYNFEVDSSRLKLEHERWLKTTVQPYYLYSRSMQAVIVGLTSRTGADEWNHRLSKARAATVDSYIFRMDLRRPRVLSHHLFAVGEEAAMLAGHPDGVEDERYRAVLLQVFDPIKVPRTPLPPPPPIKVKRRIWVLHGLTDRTTGIKSSGPDRRADRIAEFARVMLQTHGDTTPVKQKEELIDQTWTVTRVSLTTRTAKAAVGPAGHESEWLEVDYHWEPAKKGQRRFLVKNGVPVRQIDFDEMSEWYDTALKTYRRYFVR